MIASLLETSLRSTLLLASLHLQLADMLLARRPVVIRKESGTSSMSTLTFPLFSTHSNMNPRRGKKVFRRFDDDADEDEDDDDLGLFATRPDLLADNPDALKNAKTLKRSDVKPRVLFPIADDSVNDDNANNEEDATDVEDNEPMSPIPDDRTPQPHIEWIYRANLTPPLLPQQPVPNDAFVTPLDLNRRPARRFGQAPGHAPGTFDTINGEATIRTYWSTTKPRSIETRSERMKRHQETRGSPAPRTRKALRDEAAAAAATSEIPPAETSTTDI